MSTKLIEEENTVFEIDEDCLKEKSIQDSFEPEQSYGFHVQSYEKKKKSFDSWLIVILLLMWKRR